VSFVTRAERFTNLGLARLLAKYPTHGFIIDKTEAREIFELVEDLLASE